MSDFDLAGDNQTDVNPDSTEGNGNYDLGELYDGDDKTDPLIPPASTALLFVILLPVITEDV